MSETTKSRATWSGKLAFVLSAAASAVGLGSMWRFPYLAAKYGGGMFLFMYLVFVFTIGLALLLLETSLGRKTGQSCIGAFKAFGKKYAFIGIFMSAVPFIIVPYYCVIGGWVTKYLFGYIVTAPEVLADGGNYFSGFITSGAESIIFMLIFMVLTYFIVALGVNKGIEKANLIMMPALIVMAVAVAIYALTLPGAMDGLAYYLIPDFSKFSPELVISALGQTFFTLSLAMGIMVTYGSYLQKSTKLTSSVSQIAGTTFAVSLLAGLMIVPATFAALGSAMPWPRTPARRSCSSFCRRCSRISAAQRLSSALCSSCSFCSRPLRARFRSLRPARPSFPTALAGLASVRSLRPSCL